MMPCYLLYSMGLVSFLMTGDYDIADWAETALLIPLHDDTSGMPSTHTHYSVRHGCNNSYHQAAVPLYRTLSFR